MLGEIARQHLRRIRLDFNIMPWFATTASQSFIKSKTPGYHITKTS